MVDKEKNMYHNFNVDDDILNSNKPKRPAGNKVVFIVIAAALLVCCIAILFLMTRKETSASASGISSDSADAQVNIVKNFGLKFLDKFYWYNRDSYLDMRSELEKMMTVTCLEKYKRKYYDTSFENTILESYLIISSSYDRVLYRKNANIMEVKVVGDIIYENGLTGAHTKRPATWTLKIVNENDVYMIEAFEIITSST
jgi:hypothetical protein